jgi:uncharacterized membrane protein
VDKEFLLHYFLYACIGFVLSIILIPFHEKISSDNRNQDKEFKVGMFVLMFSFMWGIYLIIAPFILIKNYSKSWKEFLNK